MESGHGDGPAVGQTCKDTGVGSKEHSCRFSTYDFSVVVMDTVVHFHCLQMKDSFLLWIGTQPASLSSLAMAIPTKFDSVPLAVNCLHAGEAENLSKSLAQKLAKKCKKQVFVSYNLPSDYQLLPLVERRLFEEINTHPHRF